MEARSKFSGRYKKDMSLENLRAKVSRRKSISQKENRHKEFGKSRGLSLADANVSLIKEQDMTVVVEVNESCHVRGSENQPGNQGRTKEQVIKDERRAMLQRYKEEKQLRKLKEQREKASKGIFKCGIYRPEESFIPVLKIQTGAKVKEKPAAPSVTRITRSTAIMEPPANKTRTQTVPVNVLNSRVDGAIPKSRGQTSVLRKNEKENKVSNQSTRITRSAANATSKTATTAGKAPVKKASAAKPQVTRETNPKMAVDKSKPPVVDRAPEKAQELETILKERLRVPSFAPDNFVFQPLDGLSTFKFQPMTPNKANAFLTPTFKSSPQDGRRDFVVIREHNTEETDSVFPSEPSPITMKVKQDENVNASPPDKECTSGASSAPHTSPALTPPPCEPSMEEKTIPAQEPLHEVPYFRDILKSEIQKLTLLCSVWDKRIDMDIPEDAKDLIRTTVGQTRLLMTERFKQFEGLVDNCEFKRGEKETTCTDLDGFWDMIYFQIEDVNKKFVNLGKLEENAWQQNTVQTQAKKAVRKKMCPAAPGKSNQEDIGKAAARSRLAAIRAAMKNKVKTEDPTSEAEAPVIPVQVDPIVFDAGFFRIESPAKVPGSLCRNLCSSRPKTPRSTKKIAQNSVTPITSCVEEAAVDLKPEKSPSPAKSPIRKSLFGMPEEESLQNQEPDPIVQNPEHTEDDSVPAVVDLTQYLVPTHAVHMGAAESPGLMQCLDLEASETTQASCDLGTDIDINVTTDDDVFMDSPEKDVHAPQAPQLLETSEPGPDDDVKTTNDPLHFLGSCTPIMVQHSPMMVDVAALTDLMSFSPMEN
ncbi:disks large-associated protein 5 isoform X2 [Ranitomeya variabilis]|uniref:disks large-associated protein 5 isoform X2 n=1 Tax=Ranitomeya variabilis TaxID=490064 RepID=UPI0040569334